MNKKLTKEEFLEKLKTDRGFNNRYGRKHIIQGKMVLPPCHYGFQVYTRELTFAERLNLLGNIPTEDINEDWFEKNNIPKRAISLMFNMRSNDVPLGLPFNIASYALLLEILAKEVNMVPDDLIGSLGDCHIYLDQVEGCQKQLKREAYDLPKLVINDEFWNPDQGIIEQIHYITPDDFFLKGYKSHPAIKMPLSN